MKQIPFTIEFVTTFRDDKEMSHIPTEELEKVCKDGLVQLLAPRMKEINAGGKSIFVDFAPQVTP